VTILGERGVRALGETGVAVVDGLLGPAAPEAAAEARALATSGELHPVGMSRGASYRVDRTERGDEAAWLDAARCGPALRLLLARFAALQEELREVAFLPVRRHEVQLARYLPGARYARHRDAFPGGPGRVITAVAYLTVPGWDPGRDGGALLVHTPAGEMAIAPELDRLVAFRSELEHEVLPARRERMAASCFFHGSGVLPP
jgi:SM-20-related protein